MNLREWALPVYTILVQLATGALLVLWLVRAANLRRYPAHEIDGLIGRPLLIVFSTVLVAIVGSHFHLSRPVFSFLAIANVSNSWLSREVLFTVLLVATVGALTAEHWLGSRRPRVIGALGWLALAWGSGVVLSMAYIYLLRTQAPWDSLLTVASFFTTTLLLGVMTMAVLFVMDLKFASLVETQDQQARRRMVQGALPWLAAGAVLLTVVTVGINLRQIQLMRQGDELAQISLSLLRELYQPLFELRLGASVAGAAWLVITLLVMRRRRQAATEAISAIYIACLLVLVGEILGRFLFYATHVRVGV